MKIAIDISQIVFQGSGIATYTAKLVESLLKIDKQNHYILFASSLRQQGIIKDFYASLKDKKNTTLKLFPFPPLLLEKTWNQLHKVRLESLIGSVDVIHTSDWLEPPSHAPKVTTVHDLIVYKYPDSFTKRGGHDIVKNQKRRFELVKKESTLIMADSIDTKNDLVKILKIPASKIEVVYLAAKDNFTVQLPAKINQVKKKYKLNRDYFLSVGSREPRKNLKGTLAAFANLASKNQRIDLVIAGKYGWGEDLKIETDLKSRIHLLGFVPDEDLPALYSGAVGFVYPSFYEGFGLPVLEAYQARCPVITSNRGSLKEVAGSGAILVDPEKIDSIIKGMEKVIRFSASQRKALIEKGLKQAEKFSWDKTARQALSVYRKASS